MLGCVSFRCFMAATRLTYCIMSECSWYKLNALSHHDGYRWHSAQKCQTIRNHHVVFILTTMWYQHITQLLTQAERLQLPRCQMGTKSSAAAKLTYLRLQCNIYIARNTYVALKLSYHMMTSSNGNIFRVTGPLCGEFTGHRRISRTKASDAELWCFL